MHVVLADDDDDEAFIFETALRLIRRKVKLIHVTCGQKLMETFILFLYSSVEINIYGERINLFVEQNREFSSADLS